MTCDYDNNESQNAIEFQGSKQAFAHIASKLEDLKVNINSRIEELIDAQQKLDVGKKSMYDQVSSIKKRVTDLFEDLRYNIERKEQELLEEVEAFEDDTSTQIDDLLKLANGRAMNLSEYTRTIKEVLNSKDTQLANEFYSKNHSQIQESLITDLPQLDQITNQVQPKILISAQNMASLLDSMQCFNSKIAPLHLQISTNLSQTLPSRNSATFSKAPYPLPASDNYKNPHSNQVFSHYDTNSLLKNSVAKTMDKLKQNYYKN
jgi:hypothetical protein